MVLSTIPVIFSESMILNENYAFLALQKSHSSAGEETNISTTGEYAKLDHSLETMNYRMRWYSGKGAGTYVAQDNWGQIHRTANSLEKS